MISHINLGPGPFSRFMTMRRLIMDGQISFGGNQKLKIYGTLKCKTGKRMKAQNRVFFINEQEAIEVGYRPCASCMPHEYQVWKKQNGNQ